MEKRKFTKIAVLSMAVIMALGLAGCGGGNSTQQGEAKDITVIAREEGSGTRDAFVELTGVMEGDIDRTVDTAEISNSTSVVIQSVAGNDAAIGYISMGSMSEEVKPLNINGVEANVDNVKSGDYKLQRSFNIVTKDEQKELTEDFIDFINSADGQAIIETEGYIPVEDDPEPYKSKGLTGTITIAGSTSVAPVMEVLADKYKEINKEVTIEIQQTGSGAGIQSTIEGVCDIGMASRELDEKEDEILDSEEIALDGIAVIVNNANAVENIAMEKIMQIFTGQITNWSELQ